MAAKTTKAFIRLYMPNGGEDGVIVAIRNDNKCVEFRGNAYSKWGEGENTPMYALHSLIKRANISNLNSDVVETVTPWHAEWAAICQMFLDALDKYS